MKKIDAIILGSVVLFSQAAALDARSEEEVSLSPGALIGKYEGRLQVHNKSQTEHDFQTEIVSVDTLASTVTLIARCPSCETREWKRNSCAINEVKESIKFTCKTYFGDEQYTFNGKNMKATGFGSRFPYTISVTKVQNQQKK